MGNQHKVNNKKNLLSLNVKKDFLSANVNVICYDKGIISDFETHLNFIRIKRIVKGAIFGTDDEDLFNRVIELIKNGGSPPFILIISGSLAEQVLPKIHDEVFIHSVLIFCFDINKYSKLREKFKKIKMIENDNFENIIKFLQNQKLILAQNKKGSKFLKNYPLITFSEYENYFYDYHHIISDEYSSKALNLTEEDKSNFLTCINDKKSDAKAILNNLKNDENFHKNIINIYTKESPICYVLNKELRQLDKKTYYKINKYAASTLYSLYKYYEENKKTGEVEKILYRALNLKLADILLYKVCEGEVICYPGFTSACISAITPDKFIEEEDEPENKKKESKKKKKKKKIDEDLLLAKKLQDESERLPSPLGQEIAYDFQEEEIVQEEQKKRIVDCVDIIFENNQEKDGYPSAINISELSDKKFEEERLFPAFSFFKIKKVKINTGTKENPHEIYLEVIQKKYNLEEKMNQGERIYLDSKTNLLMTRKYVNE